MKLYGSLFTNFLFFYFQFINNSIFLPTRNRRLLEHCFVYEQVYSLVAGLVIRSTREEEQKKIRNLVLWVTFSFQSFKK